MLKRVMISGLLGALALATPALAAEYETGTMPPPTAKAGHSAVAPGAKCAGYRAQFDSELSQHRDAPMLPEAKVLRHQGGQLCDAGKLIDGAGKLAQALRDLGITPEA